MAATMLEAARDRVAGRLAADQGAEVAALGPEFLVLIAEAVLAVLDGCLARRPAAEVAARMREPGLAERLAVRRQVRELLRETHGPAAFRRRGGAELAEALLLSAKAATDADRFALLREVDDRAAG